jgi:hypothetical protein
MSASEVTAAATATTTRAPTATAERAWIKWAVIALVLATAAIHISRALVDPEISTLFWLNAIGYVVLVAMLYAPIPALDAWRGRIRWALIVYAVITIALFFLWGLMSEDWPMIGFVDKALEMALVGLLLFERRG